MIPEIHSLELKRAQGCVLSGQALQDYFLPLVNAFCQKDDAGKSVSRKKTSLIDGYSYDKMFVRIKKLSSKLNENHTLFDDDNKEKGKKIVECLKKYKGKRSPEKKKFVDNIIRNIKSYKPGNLLNMLETHFNKNEFLKIADDPYDKMFEEVNNHIKNLINKNSKLKRANIIPIESIIRLHIKDMSNNKKNYCENLLVYLDYVKIGIGMIEAYCKDKVDEISTRDLCFCCQMFEAHINVPYYKNKLIEFSKELKKRDLEEKEGSRSLSHDDSGTVQQNMGDIFINKYAK